MAGAIHVSEQPPLRPFTGFESDEGPWEVQYWKTAYCPHLGLGGPHTFFYRVRTGLFRNGRHQEEHRARERMHLWCMDNLGTSQPPMWACDESIQRGADKVETIFYFIEERDAVLFKIMCC